MCVTTLRLDPTQVKPNVPTRTIDKWNIVNNIQLSTRLAHIILSIMIREDKKAWSVDTLAIRVVVDNVQPRPRIG